MASKTKVTPRLRFIQFSSFCLKLACLLASAAESLASMLSLLLERGREEEKEEAALLASLAQREATRGGKGETIAATAAGANESLSEEARCSYASFPAGTVGTSAEADAVSALRRSFSVGGSPRGEGAGDAIAAGRKKTQRPREKEGNKEKVTSLSLPSASGFHFLQSFTQAPSNHPAVRQLQGDLRRRRRRRGRHGIG
jgi:hypothetical protein